MVTVMHLIAKAVKCGECEGLDAISTIRIVDRIGDEAEPRAEVGEDGRGLREYQAILVITIYPGTVSQKWWRPRWRVVRVADIVVGDAGEDGGSPLLE